MLDQEALISGGGASWRARICIRCSRLITACLRAIRSRGGHS